MNIYVRTVSTTAWVTAAVLVAALGPGGQDTQPTPSSNPPAPPTQEQPAPPAPGTDRPAEPAQPEMKGGERREAAGAKDRYPTLDIRDVETAIAAWDPRPEQAARAMITKYGAPNEMTSRRLYWYDNGVWLWTVVRGDPIVHNWPRPHTGVIEQAIGLRVLPEGAAEIVKFSGAVLVDRNAGVLISRGDTEAGNILAINLAHQIAAGTRDAESARREYEKLSLSSGEPSPLTERFTFVPIAGVSGDPDREVGSPGSTAAPSGTAPTVTPSPAPLERPRVPNEDKKPK